MATANETKSKAAEAEPIVDDYVMIRLPRPLPGEEDTIFVGVNGKGYRIRRGEDVEVPSSVAEVLSHSEAAKDAAIRYAEALR